LQGSDTGIFTTSIKHGGKLIPSSRRPVLHSILSEVEILATKSRERMGGELKPGYQAVPSRGKPSGHCLLQYSIQRDQTYSCCGIKYIRVCIP